MEVRYPFNGSDEYVSALRERLGHRISESAGASYAGMPLNESAVAYRSSCDALARSVGNLGKVPPGPPTLRARFGAVIIRLISRALFWYTAQITNFNIMIVNAFRQHTAVIDALVREIEGIAGIQIEFSRKVENSSTRLQRLEADSNRQAQRLRAVEDATRSHADQFRLSAARLNDLEQGTIKLRSSLALQESRLVTLIAEVGSAISGGRPVDQSVISSEQRHVFDALYLAFEDRFRGTREDIKARVHCHLERLVRAGIGSSEHPILDIGCGRGEWLEVLREAGIPASGVDFNRAMIEVCRSHGLTASEDDGIAHLMQLHTSSLGAVTAFHLIEHLPFESVLLLLDHALRALRPGGVLLLETPNPANILVGANTFYYDPTHRNPIPAPTLKMLVEARGFCSVEVIPLHPYPQSCRFPSGSDLAQLNDYFFGPQDYALFACKPALPAFSQPTPV